MLKRTLFFSSPGRLFLENSLLTYEAGKQGAPPEKHHFPVEDIGFMVLESQQITVTTACLNVLAQANVAVIVCDDSHMPVAAFQPYAGNSLAQRTTAAQLEASEALKGRLWRQTVAAKITNQAQCLARLGLPETRLRVLAGSVQNADPENVDFKSQLKRGLCKHRTEYSTISKNFKSQLLVNPDFTRTEYSILSKNFKSQQTYP